jgi:hypothetical protein
VPITPPYLSELTPTINKLEHVIHTLTEQQRQALQMSVYVGMSPEEANEYDERRQLITELTEQVKNLCAAHSSPKSGHERCREPRI